MTLLRALRRRRVRHIGTFLKAGRPAVAAMEQRVAAD
jgi:hypothetical protein